MEKDKKNKKEIKDIAERAVTDAILAQTAFDRCLKQPTINNYKKFKHYVSNLLKEFKVTDENVNDAIKTIYPKCFKKILKDFKEHHIDFKTISTYSDNHLENLIQQQEKRREIVEELKENKKLEQRLIEKFGNALTKATIDAIPYKLNEIEKLESDKINPEIMKFNELLDLTMQQEKDNMLERHKAIDEINKANEDIYMRSKLEEIQKEQDDKNERLEAIDYLNDVNEMRYKQSKNLNTDSDRQNLIERMK